MKIKNIIALGLITISVTLSNPAADATAMPTTIHEKIQTTPVSSGVVHERIERFTLGGWYNINVLRIDLNDQYTSLGSLYHRDGLSSRTTVRGLVEQRNAVAGINGDFYNANPIPSSLGVLVDNGRVLSSPNNLPTFFTTRDNTAYIDYFNKNMTITNYNTGNVLNIDTVNKLHAEFITITLLNSDWGTKSIGARFRNDLHEVLVVDGMVMERRTGGDAFDIPVSDNSYVLSSKSSNLLLFNPGDKVQTDINISPDMESIRFAIGSGSIVLRDGQVTNTDLNISGNQPRTGLGISRDQKEVIMVTVDGRDTYFKGTTQETLGNLMMELGAYNGVNLDGGGSTAMAIKPINQAVAEFVNKPTEQRNVVNGIGVFSTAPKGDIERMVLAVNSEYVFSGSTTNLKIQGYDKNNNLYTIDPATAQWSVSNGIGKVDGSTFKGVSPGNGEINVTYYGVNATASIRVLNPPVEIRTDLESISLSPGGTRTIGSIIGVDEIGREGKLEMSQVSFRTIGDVGTVKDGVFLASSRPASGALIVSSGNASKAIPVSVGIVQTPITSFEEKMDIGFSGYPADVKGSVQVTDESFDGEKAIEIIYDFSQGTNTRAAYLDFKSTSKGLLLQGSPQKLGLTVLGDSSGVWLRGTVIDSRGNSYIIDFTKSMDFNDWRYLEAQLPGNISYPISLQRIYVAEVNAEKFPTGRIVIDDLKSFSTLPVDMSSVPTSTRVQDPLHLPAESSGVKVSIYSEPKISGNTLLAKVVSSHRLKGLTESLSASSIGVQVGNMTSEFKSAISHTSTINGGSTYGKAQAEGVYVINLQAHADGIRAANGNQWVQLVSDLQNRSEPNIIISVSRPVFGPNGFNDKMEADLFHELMVEQMENGKNIFVVQSDGENSYTLKDGVRYLTLTGASISTPDDFSNYSYAEFIVNGNNITYQVKTPYNFK
ncbi:phosphodiester glycosidase family protein [Gudongella sp. DL1XJH-153]|uniref:phosphodiester glycosidase family protein n=1 Tax=Gudongella sp. DL1XJH-153 TaxID=3409804 RepID=UPI003BB6F09A